LLLQLRLLEKLMHKVLHLFLNYPWNGRYFMGAFNMKFRFLILFTGLLVFGDGLVQAKKPRATVIFWQQGSYGNYPGVGRGKPPLPIYVRVKFDENATDEYANEFFSFLAKSLNPLSKNQFESAKRIKQENLWVFKVQPSVTKEQVEKLVDQANYHFDPDYKTPQEIAAIATKQRLQQEELVRIEEEKALKKHFNEEQLAKEQSKKNDEELARKHLELWVKSENERVKRDQESKVKEQEFFELDATKHATYSVVPLPELFDISKWASFPQIFNNLGQVAGCVSNTQAALWDSKKGLIILHSEGLNTCSYALNDKGFIAALRQLKSEGMNRTILWNTSTGEVVYGPQGGPRAINDSNLILTGNYIWNPNDNTINLLTGNIGEDTTPLFRLDTNKKGSVILQAYQGHDLELKRGNNRYLLLPCCGELILSRADGSEARELLAAKLNDNDEVVALIGVKYMDKTYSAIAKWDVNRKATRSCMLQSFAELKDYNCFAILAFNNAGQLLLQAEVEDIWAKRSKKRLLLLTPKKTKLGIS